MEVGKRHVRATNYRIMIDISLKRKAERLAARLRKKARAEKGFDAELEVAVDIMAAMRESQYSFHRCTGHCELKFVDGEERTVVSEAALSNARPKRSPKSEDVGAPVLARQAGGDDFYRVNAPLGPVDYELSRYWRGGLYREVDRSTADEISRLSADYRKMIGESPLPLEIAELIRAAHDESARVESAAGGSRLSEALDGDSGDASRESVAVYA
jgi:hypothetical protein